MGWMTPDALERDVPQLGRWPVSSSARLVHFAGLLLLTLVLKAGIARSGLSEPLAELAKFLLILFLIVPILLCRVAGLTMRDLGWHRRRLGSNLALGVIGAFAAMTFLLLLLLPSSASAGELWAELTAPSLGERLSYLAMGITASFFEESLFRGYLQPTLQAKWGQAAGLVATALVFDLVHLNFSPLSLMMKFGLGLLFGVLRDRGGSLVAPFVAHALFWMLAGML